MKDPALEEKSTPGNPMLSESEPPLHTAISAGDVDTVKALLSKGHDVFEVNSAGIMAIQMAYRKRDQGNPALKIIKKTLGKEGIIVEMVEEHLLKVLINALQESDASFESLFRKIELHFPDLISFFCTRRKLLQYAIPFASESMRISRYQDVATENASRRNSTLHDLSVLELAPSRRGNGDEEIYRPRGTRCAEIILQSASGRAAANDLNSNKEYHLYVACTWSTNDMVLALLRAGANPCVLAGTVVHKHKLPLAVLVLDEMNNEKKVVNAFLSSAVRYRDRIFIQLALTRGANPNEIDLRVFAKHCYGNNLKLLLRSGLYMLGGKCIKPNVKIPVDDYSHSIQERLGKLTQNEKEEFDIIFKLASYRMRIFEIIAKKDSAMLQNFLKEACGQFSAEDFRRLLNSRSKRGFTPLKEAIETKDEQCQIVLRSFNAREDFCIEFEIKFADQSELDATKAASALVRGLSHSPRNSAVQEPNSQQVNVLPVYAPPST